jgi:hypothetical protein
MVNGIRRLLVVGSGLALTIALTVAAAGPAGAYGKANWQVAFSGNSNNTSGGGGSSGFWGWCDFAGGVTSGTDADCSVNNYFFSGGGASTGFLVSERIHGTSWDMEPTLFNPPPLPPNDFFITDGTVTLTGPTVIKAVAAGMVPPTCTLTGSTVTCSIPVLEAAGIYAPDTGVPAVAGHYSLAKILAMFGQKAPPGTHINIQVTQIP